jgi:hypothetical protein
MSGHRTGMPGTGVAGTGVPGTGVAGRGMAGTRSPAAGRMARLGMQG